MKTLRQAAIKAESKRIEALLEEIVDRTQGGPPTLHAAVRHAVFPGGARIRARLCLAVAAACGDDCPEASNAAAGAIELLHCASLVHDDLPCFDAAETRRGKPSTHVAFGEPLAVLVGDGLIVLAMESLVHGTRRVPERLPGLLATVCTGAGMPHGIVAGQAWESERLISLQAYHRAKTAALFIAATQAGAQAAGADPAIWRPLGERLGDAYQLADDLRDVAGNSEMLGKPLGQDSAHGRPNATVEMGPAAALDRFHDLANAASEAIPPCRGAAHLRTLIRLEAERLVPAEMARTLREFAA